MRPARALLSAIPLLLSLASAAGQGIYIESRGSASGAVERLWYMPHMFRALDGSGKISIVRIDKGVMYQADPEKKTYSEKTFKELKSMEDRASAMIRKRMEGMAPEQKRAFEDARSRMGLQTGQPEDTKYEVQKTDETKSISGYTCTKYVVRRDGKEPETVWATSEAGGFEDMRKDTELLQKSITTNLGNGGFGSDWYKEIPGIPIQRESPRYTHTVTRIVQQTISPSQFEPPPGYTKTKKTPLEEPKE